MVRNVRHPERIKPKTPVHLAIWEPKHNDEEIILHKGKICKRRKPSKVDKNVTSDYGVREYDERWFRTKVVIPFKGREVLQKASHGPVQNHPDVLPQTSGFVLRSQGKGVSTAVETRQWASLIYHHEITYREKVGLTLNKNGRTERCDCKAWRSEDAGGSFKGLVWKDLKAAYAIRITDRKEVYSVPDSDKKPLGKP